MQATADMTTGACQSGGHLFARSARRRWTAGEAERLSTSDRPQDAQVVSHLVALIDDYKDRTGQPSDASISRAVGLTRQAVSNWRRRGIKEPPTPEVLRKLARLMQRDYETVVLRAALLDAGWISDKEDPTPEDEIRPEKSG